MPASIHSPAADKVAAELWEKPGLKVTLPVTLLALDARRSRLIEACVMDISGSGALGRSPIPLECDTRQSRSDPGRVAFSTSAIGLMLVRSLLQNGHQSC